MKCTINKCMKVLATLIIGVGFFSSVSVNTSLANVFKPNVGVVRSSNLNNKKKI